MRFLLVIVSFVAMASAADVPSTYYFIENSGQWDGDFSFKCEVGSTIYYVTPQGMTVDFREVTKRELPVSAANRWERDHEPEPVSVRGHVVQIHYGEASGEAMPRGEGRLPHYSNYFMSQDSTKWRSRVGHFENVVVPEVWTGIDVEYRADKLGVETIYHVQPGADPAQIQMDYLGLDQPLRIDANDNLILSTSLGDLKEQAPYSYQQQGRVQQKINSSVSLLGNNRIGFELGEYDRAKELVIDPLLYGSYLGGGAQDECLAVTPAPDGGIYITGYTSGLSGFPTTPGAYDETGQFAGNRHFCSRFGPNGEFIVSTLLGEVQTQGNPITDGITSDLVYDSLRNAVWICGDATTDWPVTPDAYDTVGDLQRDAIIIQLSEDLTTLEYCSYLGGEGRDQASEIELNSTGRIIVSGRTFSVDFPVTPDALFSVQRGQDCFLVVFDSGEDEEILFSTFFGGSGSDNAPGALRVRGGEIWFISKTTSIDIPVTENAFQHTRADTAQQLGDAMIACITLSPPTVEILHIPRGGGIDEPYSLAVDDSVLFVAGLTWSRNFPVSVDAFDTIGPQQAPNLTDGFVASLNWRSGEYRGTYIGGSAGDRIMENSFQPTSEAITLLGITTSEDFPITDDAYQPNFRSELDGFVVKFTRDLRELRYGTYIGGSHIDQYNAAWIENEDSLWAVGFTLSTDLPTTLDAIQPADNGLTSGFVQHFAIDTTADTTYVAEDRLLPTEFSLSAFPNPFNPSTSLSFDLHRSTDVEIVIHDVLGREVERLRLGMLNTGSHDVQIGNNDWASGIYFATVSTKTHLQTVKLLLLR
jgi:hypothetical protein